MGIRAENLYFCFFGSVYSVRINVGSAAYPAGMQEPTTGVLRICKHEETRVPATITTQGVGEPVSTSCNEVTWQCQ